MRISDWSSDVCSSDLYGVFVVLDAQLPSRLLSAFPSSVEVRRVGIAEAVAETRGILAQMRSGAAADRTSVVSGKRESVRIDLGGPRTFQTITSKTLAHHISASQTILKTHTLHM